MEEEYYTPAIEDFHVGFEYERYEPLIGTRVYAWQKAVCHEETITTDIETVDGEMPFSAGFKEDRLRVKYLDQEDIEACGWKYTGRSVDLWFTIMASSTPGGRHSLTECKLHYNTSDHELHINGFLGEKDEGCFFEGIIKNKSELVKLMAQLNIK